MEDKSARDAIWMVAAESLAIQFLLVQLCTRVGAISPESASAVTSAFDEAANSMEDFCIAAGRPAAYAVSALELIERLRTAVIGNNPKPRHAV